MNCLKVILLYISLLSSENIFAAPFFEDYVDSNTAKKFSQFNCFKHKTCKAVPHKICGYDLKTRELAEFEDTCTLYKINCQGGFFKQVDMLACDSKKSFDSMRNTTMFEWQHVNQSVLRSPSEQTTEENSFLTNVREGIDNVMSDSKNDIWQKVIPLVNLFVNKLL